MCDPPENAEFAYTVNDVLVSDFIAPSYYDPVKSSGVRYSFTGAVERPRQFLEGGYISWRNQTNEHFEQLLIRNSQKEFRDLGPLDQSAGSAREFIDRMTEHPELDLGLSRENGRLRAAIEAEDGNRRASGRPNSCAKR